MQRLEFNITPADNGYTVQVDGQERVYTRWQQLRNYIWQYVRRGKSAKIILEVQDETK